MQHGGDLITYEKDNKDRLVDFSSNINPLGTPVGLQDQLIKEFSSLEAYPDIHYRRLKSEISNYLKCRPDQVLVGNGAVEIINNFVIDAKRVLVFKPSFSEYESRARANAKEVKELFYQEDFTIDLEKIASVLEKDDLLILGNPNNPTGLRIEKEKLLDIYKLVREKDSFLLLDEAFYEFAPSDYDSIEVFEKEAYKNVAIIRAATKFFSLPGIRLGYACSNRGKVEQLGAIELPWSVNSLADTAGSYIFKDREFIRKSREYIDKEREFLLSELSKISGIRPYTSHTNYILIKLIDFKEGDVFNLFLENGIVVRKCKSFEGLKGDHIRIAVKDRANNEKLLEVFKKMN